MSRIKSAQEIRQKPLLSLPLLDPVEYFLTDRNEDVAANAPVGFSAEETGLRLVEGRLCISFWKLGAFLPLWVHSLHFDAASNLIFLYSSTDCGISNTAGLWDADNFPVCDLPEESVKLTVNRRYSYKNHV